MQNRKFSLKKWLLASILVSFIYCPLVVAATLSHLYDVSLPTQTLSEDEKQNLFQQGLILVLERINGQSGIENYPAVSAALKEPTRFVEQYAYEGDKLYIKYSAQLINQLIANTGETVWGQTRPSVILWLALEQEPQQRHLIGAESDPLLQAELLKIAKDSGLPLVIPLLDLEDVSVVTVADVWGQFPSVLREASKRYGAQAILIGRVAHHKGLSQDAKLWSGYWQLLTDQDSPSWRVQGTTLNEVLTQGISGTTQFLKGHYGVKAMPQNPAPSKSILIEVQDIQNIQDFVKVENYFKSLDQVNRVNVYQIFSHSAIFEIVPRSNQDSQTLQRIITLDSHLISLAMEQNPIENVDLAYRWIP